MSLTTKPPSLQLPAWLLAEQAEWDRRECDRLGVQLIRESSGQWTARTDQHRDLVGYGGSLFVVGVRAIMKREPEDSSPLSIMARWGGRFFSGTSDCENMGRQKASSGL